ncbi:TPA: HNH endonuclease [Citrobacter freundii]
MKMVITQQVLKSLMHYEPVSGVFTWVKSSNRRIKVGSRAGTINGSGYRQIRIDGKIYKEHRLAWLYVYGCMPEMDVDHLDRNPLNNGIKNLRLSTKSENQYNRRKPSGGKNPIKGVRLDVKNGKWRVCGSRNKKQIWLGYFDDLELAELVISEFRGKYHGQFACQT